MDILLGGIDIGSFPTAYLWKICTTMKCVVPISYYAIFFPLLALFPVIAVLLTSHQGDEPIDFTHLEDVHGWC